MGPADVDAPERLLDLVCRTLSDLGQSVEPRSVTLDSTLDRDLGLDSLARGAADSH